MPHDTPLIATVVGGIVLAFALGTLANRFRISPLVGYLLAGLLAGPYTPGFVADQSLAPELAEIGVILLMFGVGLHFSLEDLMSVKAIAIPGAVAQIAVATIFGVGLAAWFDWPLAGGLVFGLALSVASTVVLLRALHDRHMISTTRGRIAVGWLIVEDLAMVFALVLLPALAEALSADAELATSSVLLALGITVAKVAGFVAVMLIVGRRAIPWLLHYVAHTGSRELFRLAVLAIGLGVAFGAAQLFDVSFALGAFFAGMILSESELSQRAAEESLPLRDAFAVLFFVSVGMLFDPVILLRDPLPVIATVLVIVIGKSVAALLIVLAFRHPLGTALTIAASLAQIGEFSFILAALGLNLGLLPKQGQDLVITGAIISILLNPLCFALLDRAKPWLDRRSPAPPADGAGRTREAELPGPTALSGHNLLIGYGRVGSLIAAGLAERNEPFLLLETRTDLVERARANGIEAIIGNAADPAVIALANLAAGTRLFVAIPDAFEAGQIVEQARAINPSLDIVARAHSDEEVDHLRRHGANRIVMGEREIALGMLAHAFGEAGGPRPA